MQLIALAWQSQKFSPLLGSLPVCINLGSLPGLFPLRLNYGLASTIRYLQRLFIHKKNNSCTPCVPMFSFVLVSGPPRSFFRLNQVRKVRKRCSHSRFSFKPIILGFFDRNVGLCCSCFSVAMGDRAIFVDSSNDARWKISQAEKEAELKSYKDHCRLLSLAHP